jgi:hypothetical protein
MALMRLNRRLVSIQLVIDEYYSYNRRLRPIRSFIRSINPKSLKLSSKLGYR